jgi:hypothetical protein
MTEYGSEERQNLLLLDADADEDQALEDKEPAHINTEKLADETRIERL